jgi:hypothetical protein
MKKIYFTIISLSLIIAQIAHSQPTLTAANSTFVAGESFAYHAVVTFTASPLFAIAGAGLTWDMSTVVAPPSDTNHFVTPASTPYATFFPAATVAVDNGGSYGYFFTSSSEISLMGTYSSSNSFIYTDYEKEISYPFTYGNTYTDNFTDGGMGTYGTITGTADGYGTLILPYGTFSNLLRIHYHSLSIDSTVAPADTVFEDLYVWYNAGTHGYLGEYYAINNGTFSLYGTRYLDQSSVGIENLSASQNGFSVYPNPAKDVLFINLQEKGITATKVELINTLGQTVKEALLPSNGTTNQLDVSDIPRGVYLLNVWSGQNKMCRKVIIG